MLVIKTEKVCRLPPVKTSASNVYTAKQKPAGAEILDTKYRMVKSPVLCKHQLALEQVIPKQQTKVEINKLILMCIDHFN